MGEFSRSVEQTAFGMDRSTPTPPAWFADSAAPWHVLRRFAEIVTFAIPTPDYEPWLQGATVYPDPSMATLNYPGAAWSSRMMHCSRQLYARTVGRWNHPNSANVGGGDVALFLPGSRFKVSTNRFHHFTAPASRPAPFVTETTHNPL